jgi:ribosomal protein RSM22 (predicted rRNA methylase)
MRIASASAITHMCRHMTIPSSIATAIQRWLDENGTGSLRDATAANSLTYQKGGTSAHAGMAAYLVARAPATFAASRRAMAEIVRFIPDFNPDSLLDVGAGAGSSSWAALDHWPGIAKISLLDNNQRFLETARAIASDSNVPALVRASTAIGSVTNCELPKSDLVVASYVLAELPVTSSGGIAVRLWQAASQVLLLVEPGTPAGFQRINAARSALTRAGANIVAPCTHANTCPMTGDDWCHFSVRLSRAREHMHAKSATVPFEDEPFSYLAVSRQPVAWATARIIRPARMSKSGISLRLCADTGMRDVTLPKRDKAVFKRVRKLNWGDAFKEPMV